VSLTHKQNYASRQEGEQDIEDGASAGDDKTPPPSPPPPQEERWICTIGEFWDEVLSQEEDAEILKKWNEVVNSDVPPDRVTNSVEDHRHLHISKIVRFFGSLNKFTRADDGKIVISPTCDLAMLYLCMKNKQISDELKEINKRGKMLVNKNMRLSEEIASLMLSDGRIKYTTSDELQEQSDNTILAAVEKLRERNAGESISIYLRSSSIVSRAEAQAAFNHFKEALHRNSVHTYISVQDQRSASELGPTHLLVEFPCDRDLLDNFTSSSSRSSHSLTMTEARSCCKLAGIGGRELEALLASIPWQDKQVEWDHLSMWWRKPLPLPKELGVDGKTEAVALALFSSKMLAGDLIFSMAAVKNGKMQETREKLQVLEEDLRLQVDQMLSTRKSANRNHRLLRTALMSNKGWNFLRRDMHSTVYSSFPNPVSESPFDRMQRS